MSPTLPATAARTLMIAAAAFSAFVLVLSLRAARREMRVRPGFEYARIVLGAGTVVVLGAFVAVHAPVALLALATALGLAAGHVQGSQLTIALRDGRVFARRSVAGVTVWGASLVAMQLAGLGSSTGVFRVGVATGVFGTAMVAGAMWGRSRPVRAAKLVAFGSPWAAALVVVTAAVAGFGATGKRAGAQSDERPAICDLLPPHLSSREAYGDPEALGDPDNPAYITCVGTDPATTESATITEYATPADAHAELAFYAGGEPVDTGEEAWATDEVAARRDRFLWTTMGNGRDGSIALSDEIDEQVRAFLATAGGGETTTSAATTTSTTGDTTAGSDTESESSIAPSDTGGETSTGAEEEPWSWLTDGDLTTDEGVETALGGVIASLLMGLLTLGEAEGLLRSILSRAGRSPDLAEDLLRPFRDGTFELLDDEEEGPLDDAALEEWRASREYADGLAQQADDLAIEAMRYGVDYEAVSSQLDAIRARAADGTATGHDLAILRATRDLLAALVQRKASADAGFEQWSAGVLGHLETIARLEMEAGKAATTALTGPLGGAAYAAGVETTSYRDQGAKKALGHGAVGALGVFINEKVAAATKQLGAAARIVAGGLTGAASGGGEEAAHQLIDHGGDTSKLDTARIKTAGLLSGAAGALGEAAKLATEVSAPGGRIPGSASDWSAPPPRLDTDGPIPHGLAGDAAPARPAGLDAGDLELGDLPPGRQPGFDTPSVRTDVEELGPLAGRHRASPVDTLPGTGGTATGPATGRGEAMWGELGADGRGRVYDRHGNHILNVDPDGTVRTPAGAEVQPVTRGDVPAGYVDGQGRTIVFAADGTPHQLTRVPVDPDAPITVRRGDDPVPARELGYGGDDALARDRTVPAPDVPPAAASGRVALDGRTRAQWQALGAGPRGELYGPNGEVIGTVDASGAMTTNDGRPIRSVGQVRHGRIEQLTTADGALHGRPGDAPPRAPVAGDESLAPDALAEQARRDEAARQARWDAPTGKAPAPRPDR